MASISKERAKLIAQGFFSKLGAERTDNPKLYGMEAVLEDYARVFEENVTDNLEKDKKVQTGALSTQQAFNIEQHDNGYTLTVGYVKGSETAGYYDFVNKGVQGFNKSKNKNNRSPYSFKSATPGRKMVKAIEQWINTGQKLTRNDTKTHTGLSAYLVARSIKNKGFKYTGFFDKAIEKTFSTLPGVVATTVGVEVEIAIKQTNDNNTK